ncbi:hypothetical protein C7S16_3538 [Burkholderia thailandensis]|uniref:Uncharacterized protein n=1 Tax=Burkholderia thailandensis TaxID=57975 RepID=A0AAW9CZW6_BURTH|nr:hypothetical protein [Burkholderia thailandensis]MDW9256200.1 hypothetical protein [Burkholderia thailandensis]
MFRCVATSPCVSGERRAAASHGVPSHALSPLRFAALGKSGGARAASRNPAHFISTSVTSDDRRVHRRASVCAPSGKMRDARCSTLRAGDRRRRPERRRA